jgi:ubiquinone biosynthesis protein
MTDTANAHRTLLKHSSRVTEIVRTLAKYGFASWAVGAPDKYQAFLTELTTHEMLEMSDGERVRMVCLDLGTTFIKVGQILSTRTDLVGDDIAAALSTLQGDVPADSPSVVQTTVEEELGSPIDQLFATFDDQPLGSASIAQVHAATLPDGTQVVLKVQHPGIRKIIEDDLDILEALATLAQDRDPDLALYRPVEIAAQLRRSLLAETDFKLEASSRTDSARISRRNRTSSSRNRTWISARRAYSRCLGWEASSSRR